MPGLIAIEPPQACPGGQVTLHGSGLLGTGPDVPRVRVGGIEAHLVSASPSRVRVRVPAGLDGGLEPVSISTAPGAVLPLHVAEVLASGIHQVDNPAFGADGALYVTYSGTRGEQVPVSIFRLTGAGARESFSSGIVNPTSMITGPDGGLYVSSRFEGTVYRVDERGSATPYVTDVGVPCGLVFDADGQLIVGDRSGTIFRVDRDGHATTLATLPPSIAAYHLAAAPDGSIYVAVPTLSASDRIYQVHPDGRCETAWTGFGRPQGLAVDASGVLHAVEALAGSSGLLRLVPGEPPALVASGAGLVGVAFDPAGGFVLASNDTVYRFDRQDAPPAPRPH